MTFNEGIVLDFDADGNLVGIDIDHASTKADLTHLTIDSLPLSGTMSDAHATDPAVLYRYG